MNCSIRQAAISTISLSCDNEDLMKKKASELLKLVSKYKGIIIRRMDFSDGIFLEVKFHNEKLKEDWEKEIGVK